MVEKFEEFQKVKDLREEFIKFFDEKRLYKNLALSALYLATFEMLKSAIIENIRTFFRTGEDDSKKEMPLRYKEIMKDYFKRYTGQKDWEYQACCDWLCNMEAISQSEREQLTKIKEQRNEISHELQYILFDPKKNVDISLLEIARDMVRKIDVWWIMNVDIPCNENFDDRAIQEDEIVPSRVLMLNHVFKSFLNQSEQDS